MSTEKQAVEMAQRIGKTVNHMMVFQASSQQSFVALRQAEQALRERGYSYGVLCGDEPVALLNTRGRRIAKWKNIDPSEYPLLDGMLVSDDFRDGNVSLVLFS